MGAGKRRPRTRVIKSRVATHFSTWERIPPGGKPSAKPRIKHRLTTRAKHTEGSPPVHPTLAEVLDELSRTAAGVKWSDIRLSGTFYWDRDATQADIDARDQARRDAEARSREYRRRQYEKLKVEFESDE